MWRLGGLQVYGICSHRLVFSEVVEAWSNYKKFYLWWFRNPACGDSAGSNRIQKDRVGAPLGLVWGIGEGGVVWLSVSEAPLHDRANNYGSGDVFSKYGEYIFSSMGI